MNEAILDTQLLPELIRKHIHTPRVRVCVMHDEVILLPVVENDCVINRMYGMLKGGSMTVDGFLHRTSDDNKLER